MVTRKVLKRTVKALSKKLLSLKRHLQDQAFYLKQLFLAVKNTLYLTLGFILLGTFMILCTLTASRVHLDYIEKHVGSQVLMIRSPEGAKFNGSGTGFEVKAPSGKVVTVTNGHVCELGKDGIILVEDKSNSKRFVPKRILEVYDANDLCIVEGMEGYSGLTVASGVDIGEEVWAVGYPLGGPLDVSQGITKAYDLIMISLQELFMPNECVGHRRELIDIPLLFGITQQVCVIKQHALETNVIIYPGNSGSPLVNVYGNVVAVVFASSEETHWGSAVPLTYLKDALKAY